MRGTSVTLKQYMATANKGLNVPAEVAQLMAFSLRTAVVGVQLIDEFLPTIPKDENYAARMEGPKRFYSGLTTMFVGAETSLSETAFYSPDHLSLLLDAMAETLPSLKKIFSPDYKLEFRKKLESRKSAFPRASDTQKIQKTIDELGA